MRLLLLALIAALMPVAAAAQVKPQAGTGDPRVQSVSYNADQVVLLQAAPGYQVTVELAPDEHIENVAVGDSGAWQVASNKRGDHLFIKPIRADVSTNMVIVTDVRVYAFELVPLYGPQPDMAYTVRFRYPPPPGSAPAGAASNNSQQAAQAPRGRYRVSGDRAIRPSGIDDDGARTYIEWPASHTLPAIYSIDAKGNEMLVNGNMREGIYVIDSVVPKLIFRLDKQIARATRVDKGGAN